jgi:hypothetical protein
VALVTAAKEVEPSLGVRLLANIREVFDADKLPTKVLLEKLCALPESLWRDLRGKPLDDRGLANRLRQYDIKSRDVRTSTGTLKGYHRADFQDAWARYLPPIGEKSATSATSATSVANQAVGLVDSVAETARRPSPTGTLKTLAFTMMSRMSRTWRAWGGAPRCVTTVGNREDSRPVTSRVGSCTFIAAVRRLAAEIPPILDRRAELPA